MNRYYFSIFTALVAIFCVAAGCNEEPKSNAENKLGFDPANAKFQPDAMPTGTSPAVVEYRDPNCYTSGDFFFILLFEAKNCNTWFVT